MMPRKGKVLICGEFTGGGITSTTAELIQHGRVISDLFEEPLHLFLIGDGAQEAAEEAVQLGADKVYLSQGLPFSESHPESWLARILQVIGQIEPTLILIGQTDMGREIAPRLAARIEASVCLDCVKIEVDPASGSLLQTKPVYGGNALAVWTSSVDRPRIVTLRPRSAEPAKPDSSRRGEILQVEAEIDESQFQGKLLDTVKEDTKGIKLEEAKVIVSGGGGIGGKDGFRWLEELAGILQGAVGISRVPCDEGWMPKRLEIGQTGLVVSPDLYIAVGLSGAPQHMAGCSHSKCIVAFNKDSEAHIFKEADYGIVGDYKEALPAFIEALKSLLGN
jgi:electron transfer flavoprotein alpha subunit